MSDGGDKDIGSFSMLELFAMEVSAQAGVLDTGIAALRAGEQAPVEDLMRAAHSLKGAARMVDIEPARRVAAALEDIFAESMERDTAPAAAILPHLARGVELLRGIAGANDGLEAWLSAHGAELEDVVGALGDGDAATAASGPSAAASDPGPALELETSMLDLFRVEVENHARVLSDGLLALEQDPGATDDLESLMRAAHSIKGAARMVGMEPAVRVAHAMEDCFVAAQGGRCALEADGVDVLLRGVDMLTRIGALEADEADAWLDRSRDELAELVAHIEAVTGGARPGAPAPAPAASGHPPRDPAMLELYRTEVETHGTALTEGLLALEQDPNAEHLLETLMRAAHSLKGAGRMVELPEAVDLAHTMEDCFVSAQAGRLTLTADHIDVLLGGVDMLTRIAEATTGDLDEWLTEQHDELAALAGRLGAILAGPVAAAHERADAQADEAPGDAAAARKAAATAARDTAIRVSAESLNRLMGLAGEVQVESRWLRPYVESMVQIKHRQSELISALDKLWMALEGSQIDDYTKSLMASCQHKAGLCRHQLGDKLVELEEYDRRNFNLANRLSREVIASRMRPFADGVHGFQRMVRDIARQLGKQVKLEIRGLNTQVDRDILEKIEAPLNHMVRNALDHGIETPEERERAGKPAQATLRIEAMHASGMLTILIEDDGRGIDPEGLRTKVVAKGLVSEDMAAELSDTELMEFLFLPGFSTRDNVTDLSGRGVGLDVVHSVIQEMRGVVRPHSTPGQGTRFHMQLPLTLSVVRALLVEIAGDPYAFPLARIDRTFKLSREHIETMEGREYFTLGNQHIGIVAANQVLNLGGTPNIDDEVCVVVLGERLNRYGLVVDRFLGERSLVVQTLDNRLGKIKDVAAASVLENGVPCLILDVDDLLRSVDLLASGGRLDKFKRGQRGSDAVQAKRILVVDDSITVREVERKMLSARGYDVDVAVDGMDGWNTVRAGQYDLVISDIDMPRMNGFEFVGLIKQDPNLRQTPVMIVSYKDREEDRARGLEVGADYYLTKGSFQDETLLDAVMDLIGDA